MAKKKSTTRKSTSSVPIEQLEGSIHVIRGQRVMLDADLAELYGVTTAALNQSVKRNQERFSDDFAFQLTRQEFTALISQNVISKTNTGRGGRQSSPWAFTEHGVAMLSSVLRSKKAAQVNVEIMRAFVRIRRLLATPGELVEQLQRLAESVQLHDSQIKAITRVLQQMMEPPADKPTGRIGFRSPEKSNAESK